MSGVTFIISARNEYPQVAMTVDNLMLDCWQAGIHDWEVIIADNGSTDNTSKFWKYAFKNPYAKHADHQLPEELQYSPRGMANEGRIKFVYDPVFSNVGARHLAVQYAKYENIIFADAHISLKPGTVKYVLETLDKFGGVVHAPVAWMGASVYHPHPGMQYTYKIGEKIWGTWNYAQTVGDAPFYIPLSGHCFIAVKKKEYMDFGGYDTHQQIYGGGENYLDTLYWLLGSNVMVDPRGLVFHLSAGRGYSYNQTSLIHNMILTAYTLGGEKWSERIFLTYLDKTGTDIKMLKEMYAKTLEEGKEKRELIASRQIMSLEDLLGINRPNDCDGAEYKMQAHAKRIWDIKNDELHGHHISFVTVFGDWIDRLKTEEAKDFFVNSLYQKET
jgi:glycosyltransferase involved in cell wall biosynthesis